MILLNVLVTSKMTGQQAPAGATPAAQQQDPCPGQATGVLATGVYTSVPVQEVPINGAPWESPLWQPGHRSYWHCHRGGQILLVWQGEGRVQRRGERVTILQRGVAMIAEPGEEHWHGASPTVAAQFLQVSLPGGSLWMEEATDADYLGNDIGISSRNRFLETGVREQPRR